jgi:hypothetical protein
VPAYIAFACAVGFAGPRARISTSSPTRITPLLRDQVLAKIDIAIVQRGAETLQRFRAPRKDALPALRADGGKNAAAARFTTSKTTSPMRITFQYLLPRRPRRSPPD